MGAENKYDLQLSPNYNPDQFLSNTTKSSNQSSSSISLTTTYSLSSSLNNKAETTTIDSSAAKGILTSSIHSHRKSSSTSNLIDNSTNSCKDNKLTSDSTEQTSSSADNLKRMQSEQLNESTMTKLTRAKGDISLSEIKNESDRDHPFNLQCLSPTKEEENEDDEIENDSYQLNKCAIDNNKVLKNDIVKSKNEQSTNSITKLPNELLDVFTSSSNKVAELLNNNLKTVTNNNTIEASNNETQENKNAECSNNQSAMSVSVPNLSLNGDSSASENESSTTASSLNSLMEAFSSLTRKPTSSNNNNNNNSNNMNSFNNVFNNNNSNNNQLCSLVRLALASNFPELFAEIIGEFANSETCSDFLQNQLLSNAQSYPTLTNDSNSTTVTLTDANHDFPQVTQSGNSSSGFTTSSENELFENCATNLLSGIEDELNDENDEEIDFENEDYDYVSLIDDSNYNLQKNKKKNWDDDYVLKRHFPELIPEFDPRPGRTNINQTVDLEIQEPSNFANNVKKRKSSSGNNSESGQVKGLSPKIMLSFKLTNSLTNKEFEIDLVNPNWTIFSAVQYLTQISNGNSRQEKLRRVWESICTIGYREIKDEEVECIDRSIPIHKATIRTTNLSNNEVEEILNVGDCSNDLNFRQLNDVLTLLKLLYLQALESYEQKMIKNNNLSDLDSVNDQEFDLFKEDFISKKITNKLMQQILDSLVLTSASYPEWCEHLMYNYSMLFPFEIRKIFFQSTSFGTSRSIVWLQNQRDLVLERSHTHPSPRREDSNEFRLGRLLHQRVRVPRTSLLNWSMEVLRVTASKKSILEVEFVGEQGTGLGPSLEFYQLVAAELQRKNFKMWLCDDSFIMINDFSLPTVDSCQDPDFYVNYSAGLFPAPLDQNHKNIKEVCQMFEFLGTFIAKALQDNRLVDLPLSLSFLKLFSHPSSKSCSEIKLIDKLTSDLNAMTDRLKQTLPLSDEEELIRSRSMIEKESKLKIQEHTEQSWLKGVLNEFDFQQLFPNHGKFLSQLKELSNAKQKILSNPNLTLNEKQNQINNLYIPMNTDNQIRLESLSLTFQVSQFCHLCV